MPCEGSAMALSQASTRAKKPPQTHDAAWKNTDLILVTIPLVPCFLAAILNPHGKPRQTFSLDWALTSLIKTLLLDRFLACMKPASIT